MTEFYIFESDPLVRADIIDIVGELDPRLAINVAETTDFLANRLSLSSNSSVVILSGQSDQLDTFFSQTHPSLRQSFVVIGDGDRSFLPEDYFISPVLRPFSDKSLSEGIKNALSFLRSDH